MPKTETYTLFAKTGDGESVIARDVPLARALVVAAEHGRSGNATIVHRDWCEFRVFEIGCRSPDGVFAGIIEVSVKRTRHPNADTDDAMERFEEILLHDPRVFFDGRIESDFDRKARRHNVIGEAS